MECPFWEVVRARSGSGVLVAFSAAPGAAGGATGKDPRAPGASSEKEVLFNLHCVGGKTRGPWRSANLCLQAVWLCLFFWPLFFFPLSLG